MYAQDNAPTGAKGAKPARRAGRGQGSVKLIGGYWRATFVPASGHPKVTLRSANVTKGGLQRHALDRMTDYKADFKRLSRCPADVDCRFCAAKESTRTAPFQATTFTTLGDWVKYCLAFEMHPDRDTAHRVDVVTFDGYTGSMTCHVLKRAIAQVRLRDLSRDDIERWWQEMEAEGVGPGARKKAKRVLGTILTVAVERRARTGLEYNPAHAYKLAPERGRNKRIVASPRPEREQALVQAATASDPDGVRGLILTFGHRLGLRRQEILGLQFGDFDLQAGMLRVQRRVNRVTGLGVVVRAGVKWGSLDSGRLLPLDPVWTERLQRQRDALVLLARRRGAAWTGADPRLPSAFLFPNDAGEAWDPRACAKWFAVVVKAAGLTGGMHKMRHDFITAKVLQGLPLAKVALLAGHEDIATTMGYTHLDASHLREAPGQFEQFWAADGAAAAS